MKKNLTWLIFVIDRSGSMSGIATDMIGGFNQFIKKQKAVPGDCRVFAYQFDDHYDMIHDGINLQNVPELTDKTYVPRGCTALYCSLGKTIADIGRKLAEIDEKERPEKVLVITITDGLDNDILRNSEVRYSCQQVREMITHQTEKYGWDFVYIGANQDSWTTGESMGIRGSTKLNYCPSAVGVSNMYDTLSDATSQYRTAAGAKFAFKAADVAGKTDDKNDDES